MPSRSGVRIAGDEYQWRVAWRACVEMLREARIAAAPDPVVTVEIEAPSAGNVDDVVQTRASGDSVFTQVKYATDGRSPLSLEQLREGRLLARLVESYRLLTGRGFRATIRLTTNREIDPHDKLLSCRDGRDNKLVPRGLQGTPASALGLARAEWAAAAECEIDEFAGFLVDFAIESALTTERLTDELALLMHAAGLRSSDDSVAKGVNWIRRQVMDGTRSISVESLEAAVEELGLRMGPPWATLSVSMVDEDPFRHDADVVVDLVARMEGTRPAERLSPLAPDTWHSLAGELEGSLRAIPPGPVLVTGYVRLASAFKIGSELSAVRGYTCAWVQRGELWQSNAAALAPPTMNVEENSFGSGGDIALVVQVAARSADAALDWVRRGQADVGKLVVVSSTRIGPNSISSGSEANAMAVAIRDVARSYRGKAERIHLFLICPAGLAFLVGHYWNRVAPTVVYEHVKPTPAGENYEPAYLVEV